MDKKVKDCTFALVIPRFEDIFHSFYAGEIIKGVGLAASRLKVDILMHVTDRLDHQDWINASALDRDYIDGIIFADINNDVDMLRKVIQKGIPYIVLNNSFEEPINYVAIDNKKAAFSVTEYLINYGHRNIATITGDLSTQAGRLRLDGYRNALRIHNLPLRDEYLTTGDFLRTPARESARKLLKLKDRPTAIFAASDVMALELIDEARQQNLRIPEDISVIGFDNNPLNAYSPVRLSTVAQPIIEMGRLGVEHLHQLMSKPSTPSVRVLLDTRFVAGNSVKKV